MVRSSLFFYFSFLFLEFIQYVLKSLVSPSQEGTLRFSLQAGMVLTSICRTMLHPELILFYENVTRLKTKQNGKKNSHSNSCFHLVVFKYNLAIGVWFKINRHG